MNPNLNPYEVVIVFKNSKSMAFKIFSDKNPRESLEKSWESDVEEGAFALGDYIINIHEVLYIKVKGQFTPKPPKPKNKIVRKKGKK